MAEFYIRELKSGNVFRVLNVAREDGKTLFLVWTGSYFKWLDVRKVEYLDTSWG